MWNVGYLYLDSHLEKLLESIFLSKSLFMTIKKYIKDLLEMLLEHCQTDFGVEAHPFLFILEVKAQQPEKNLNLI